MSVKFYKKKSCKILQMEAIYVIPIIISVIYICLKYLEKKILKKEEDIPLKEIMYETLLVGISSMAGVFLSSQIYVVEQCKTPSVFTDNPEF